MSALTSPHDVYESTPGWTDHLAPGSMVLVVTAHLSAGQVVAWPARTRRVAGTGFDAIEVDGVNYRREGAEGHSVDESAGSVIFPHSDGNIAAAYVQRTQVHAYQRAEALRARIAATFPSPQAHGAVRSATS